MTNLSVNENDPLIQYTSTGETSFPYDFPIRSADEISVSVDRVLKVHGTDYTLTGIGNAAGGIVVFTSATVADEVITFWLDKDLKRTSGFSEGVSAILPDDLNTEFADHVRNDQMLRRDLRRTIHIAPDDVTQYPNMVLPAHDTGAQQYIIRDTDGRISTATVGVTDTTPLTAVVLEGLLPYLPKEFATVALLAVEDGLTIGNRITTAAYATAGDGGGATYQAVADGTFTDGSNDHTAGGSFIQGTGSPLLQYQLVSPVINEKMFGYTVGGAALPIENAMRTAYRHKRLELSADTDFLMDQHIRFTIPDGENVWITGANSRLYHTSLHDDATDADWSGCILSITGETGDVRFEGFELDGGNYAKAGLQLNMDPGATVEGSRGKIHIAITARNCKWLSTHSSSFGSRGISIKSKHDIVDVSGSIVEDISREDGTGTAGTQGTNGISCEGYGAGTTDNGAQVFKADRIVVRNILNEETVAAANVDSDGLAVFNVGAVDKNTSTFVTNSVFENCMGRSIKGQTTYANVSNNHFVRDGITAKDGGFEEVELQYGSGSITHNTATYYYSGGVNPFTEDGAAGVNSVVFSLYSGSAGNNDNENRLSTLTGNQVFNYVPVATGGLKELIRNEQNAGLSSPDVDTNPISMDVSGLHMHGGKVKTVAAMAIIPETIVNMSNVSANVQESLFSMGTAAATNLHAFASNVRNAAAAVTLTDTSISFAATTISDSNNGLAVFHAGDRVKVTGSTSNNFEDIVTVSTAGALTLFGLETWVTEAAGDTVTIEKVRDLPVCISVAAHTTAEMAYDSSFVNCHGFKDAPLRTWIEAPKFLRDSATQDPTPQRTMMAMSLETGADYTISRPFIASAGGLLTVLGYNGISYMDRACLLATDVFKAESDLTGTLLQDNAFGGSLNWGTTTSEPAGSLINIWINTDGDLRIHNNVGSDQGYLTVIAEG